MTINQPGEYLTRKGEVVHIVSRKPCEFRGTVWRGWIQRTSSDGRTHPQWSDWSTDGTFGFGTLSPFDIVVS